MDRRPKAQHTTVHAFLVKDKGQGPTVHANNYVSHKKIEQKLWGENVLKRIESNFHSYIKYFDNQGRSLQSLSEKATSSLPQSRMKPVKLN